MDTKKAQDFVRDQFHLKDKAVNRYALTCVFLVVALLGLAGMCMKLANAVKVIPYIVQVDQHGYEVVVGPLQAQSDVDERVVLSRVASFVTRWRTVVSDVTAQKDLIDWVYSCIPANSNAEHAINSWYSENNPYEIAGKKITRAAEVKAVLKVSPTVWRIEWEEKDSEQGVPVKITRWTGLFTVGITPPTALQEVLKNPLGVYVVEYSVNPNIG